MSEGKSQPLPKFGEWDVNDPASADSFTVIFNKARDEKKTGGNIRQTDSPGKEEEALKSGTSASKPPVCGISNNRKSSTSHSSRHEWK